TMTNGLVTNVNSNKRFHLNQEIQYTQKVTLDENGQLTGYYEYITGSQDGYTPDSTKYEIAIESSKPLTFSNNYRWYVSGEYQITFEEDSEFPDASVDFGFGDADNVIDLKLDGNFPGKGYLY
ncbi:MAG: hypothetical protein MI739_08935, partial [Bacteroidales bacterium]|nr:hypothetical protein [Bacteroidales bacterium]